MIGELEFADAACALEAALEEGHAEGYDLILYLGVDPVPLSSMSVHAAETRRVSGERLSRSSLYQAGVLFGLLLGRRERETTEGEQDAA